jgi:peptidoglycan/LPS O-acetylase OafA/YrhL
MNMHNERVAVLDGWRGIAIIMVVADHVNRSVDEPIPWLNWFGQHGVTLFFVLSGYLITSRLKAEMERTGGVDLKAFYVRRFFRLQPCAWVFLAAVTILFSPSIFDILSCLVFARNFIHANTWTTHFWSLSIEEQFYLFWPPVFVLLRKRKSAAAAAAIAGAALSVAWRWSHPIALVVADFPQSTHTLLRSDALFIGCVAALVPLPTGRTRKVLTYAAWVVFLAYLAVWREIPPALESIAIAVLLADTSTRRVRFLEFPALVNIGLASYSVYVWQALFAGSVLHHSLWFAPVELLGIALVSFASYRLVEIPFQRPRPYKMENVASATPPLVN